MSDTANVRQWSFGAVYVSFDLNAADPATIDDDFGVDWEEVGILDGDDGFTETRDEEVTDLFGWGVGVIKTSRKNFKLTRTFTALEWNTTTDRLRYPGSNDLQIVVPQAEQVKVAFETRDGISIKRRIITANYAEVAPDGDVNENESDLSKVPFVVTVFPDTTDPDRSVLFNRQSTAGLLS